MQARFRIRQLRVAVLVQFCLSSLSHLFTSTQPAFLIGAWTLNPSRKHKVFCLFLCPFPFTVYYDFPLTELWAMALPQFLYCRSVWWLALIKPKPTFAFSVASGGRALSCPRLRANIMSVYGANVSGEIGEKDIEFDWLWWVWQSLPRTDGHGRLIHFKRLFVEPRHFSKRISFKHSHSYRRRCQTACSY